MADTRVAGAEPGTLYHSPPTAQAGLTALATIASWITTVDHKRIGILYGVTAFLFFLMGGIEALIMRAQLARPDNDLVSAQTFNELFTMHGTSMVFLALMPASVAFFNYLVVSESDQRPQSLWVNFKPTGRNIPAQQVLESLHFETCSPEKGLRIDLNVHSLDCTFISVGSLSTSESGSGRVEASH